MKNDRTVSVVFSEKDFRRRNRELSALLELSNFLSSARGLNELLNGALKKVLAFFRLEAGRIYLKDEEKPFLVLAAHQGMEPEGLERVHVDEGFSGKAYRTRAYIVQHVLELEDKRRAALLLGKGFETIVCVPLIYTDKVGGVMNLAANKAFRPNQHQVDLLTTMGNQIAVAANHAKLYEDLTYKLQVLREKKEMIKFFAYSVSHDLKSPAVGIHGLTKRFKEKYADTLDEKGQAYCDQILKTAEHMVALVEKINTYIRTRESALNIDRIDVAELLRGIQDEFSEVLEERGVRWILPKTLPEVLADRISLARLFRNLLDNALKYGGNALSEIRIQYRSEEGFHIFRFSDDGIGLSEKDSEKIFELFHRDVSSRGTEGAGLGLAIVKEIAERHGGCVTVEKGASQGASFRIVIAKNLSDGD
jgi:signal transduction histidine kinase